MIQFRGKHVHVVGLGSLGTGRETARALARRGAEVTVHDIKPEAELAGEIAKLRDLNLTFRLGAEAYAGIEGAELIVLSPGVPPTLSPLELAGERGVPIVSEIEVAFWLAPCPIIAVTGTKGKTTTTTLIGRLLEGAGRAALVGGNIGHPLIELASRARGEDLLVAEVSSFQLQMTREFRPRVGVLLNFFADHLDRHARLAEYWEAKAACFLRQTREDFAVINQDEPRLRDFSKQLAARVIPFSLEGRVPGAWLGEEKLWLGEQPLCPARAVRLRGRHNLANALAALGVMLALELPRASFERTLSEFRGVEHRLEEVGEVGGVSFFNDSQATTPEAVMRALEAFEEPVLLIAGGRPKVSDFSELGKAIARKAKAVFLIGEAAGKIAAAARAAGFEAIEEAESLPAAVRAAFRRAEPGEVVLLSPACASFDMFRNMAERGEVFKQTVRELRGD